MLRILDSAKLSVAGGSVWKIAEVLHTACERMLYGRDAQIRKMPGRIAAVAPLLVLVVISLLACGDSAFAQQPPNQVQASALGPSAVQVKIIACQVTSEDNCNYGFSVYRNPPGFTQPPITPSGGIPLGYGAYNTAYEAIWTDTKVKAGQGYTYRVCTGSAPNSDGSNCVTTTPVTVPAAAPVTPPPTVSLTVASTSIPKGSTTGLTWTSTNATSLKLEPGVGKVSVPSGSTTVGPGTYTITATGPGGQATYSVSITTPCFTPWAPPSKMSALLAEDIHLAWTNPNTTAAQTCPAPPAKVLIYRMGGADGWWKQLAELNKTSSGILPTHYTDSDILQPHTGYQYKVCEGGSPNWQNPVNCASPPISQHDGVTVGIITWGANPVLSATRVNPTTVKLQIALDQYTVSSIVVTRQGSDDPCRQGGTLGNGLQGCRTTGANGLGGSPAHTVTVYNWTESSGPQYPPGFQNSTSAPFVINLPDDTTVKPGVEYYYLAQVVWSWSAGQDSNTVTVPNAYATATLQQSLAGGSHPIKLNGNAPPPPSQSRTAATTTIRPGSRTITPAASSPMRRPARSTTAPLLAQPATAATPPIAPAKTTTSRMISPVQPAQMFPTPANLNASIKEVQQKPHDPQALYALGRAYCTRNQSNTGVNYMYMALILAEQAGNAPLTAQIKTSLAEQGVSTK